MRIRNDDVKREERLWHHQPMVQTSVSHVPHTRQMLNFERGISGVKIQGVRKLVRQLWLDISLPYMAQSQNHFNWISSKNFLGYDLKGRSLVSATTDSYQVLGQPEKWFSCINLQPIIFWEKVILKKTHQNRQSIKAKRNAKEKGTHHTFLGGLTENMGQKVWCFPLSYPHIIIPFRTRPPHTSISIGHK